MYQLHSNYTTLYKTHKYTVWAETRLSLTRINLNIQSVPRSKHSPSQL